MEEYLPRIGEKCYYMHREVIVIDVLDFFHLVKIKDLSGKYSVCVDKCTLTRKPDFVNTISLRLFGGENK